MKMFDFSVVEALVIPSSLNKKTRDCKIRFPNGTAINELRSTGLENADLIWHRYECVALRR